jgi:hypothetical protein
MTTVTIHELTGERRKWVSTHETSDRLDALESALTQHFGCDHGFYQDAALRPGYGCIVHLAPLPHGGGAMVLDAVRIHVEG